MSSEVFLKPVKGQLKDCIRDCFDTFGGVEKLTKGNVFIKINGTVPNRHAMTSTEVAVAAVEVVRENPKVKKIYVFDNAASGMFTRIIFAVDKLAKRVKKAGGTPLYLDEQKPIMWDLKGTILGEIPLPEILIENLIKRKDENTYINIPKLKVHGQVGVSIGIKNQHGLLYDEEKLFAHHHIHEKLIDLLGAFRPDFTIVDALHVCDYGAIPFKSEWSIPMNVLLAGTDPVAVDTIASTLIGLDTPLAKHIQMADAQGFGTCDRSKIIILPSLKLLEEHKIQCHCEASPIGPEDMIIYKGTDKCCPEGCFGLADYLCQLVYDAKHKPCNLVVGKGHTENKAFFDSSTEPFFVIGLCAVTELKDYFENRSDRNAIKVNYLADHFNPKALIPLVIKDAGISLSALSNKFSVGMMRIIFSYLNAKLHGVRCNFL